MRRSDDSRVIEARLKRLAGNIESLAERDERQSLHTREMAEMREHAAATLYRICADFVRDLNGLLSNTEVILDPPEPARQAFHEEAPNLLQINVRGRILQIAFEATPELLSTEDFRIPYTLKGAIRAFNQELLEKDVIEEQLIFYTLEKPRPMWRFFDARTYRSGPLDQEYLISLMERLI